MAVANAVNDALRVLGAREITEVPITLEGVLSRSSPRMTTKWIKPTQYLRWR